MADPMVIFDRVARIEAAAMLKHEALERVEGKLSVHFAGGQVVTLDPEDSKSSLRAEILRSVQGRDAPVYVKADIESQNIEDLLLPLRALILDITPMPTGDMAVRLEMSSSRHFLRRESNANFEKLLAALMHARATGVPHFVTSTLNDHNIVDMREAQGGLVKENLPDIPDCSLTLSSIPLGDAEKILADIEIISCRPGDPSSSSCIPFLYPDNGCWARADEMCRLILAKNQQPGKIWATGNLTLRTENHPNCEVACGLHVAVIIDVKDVGMDGAVQRNVIDPTLFPGKLVPLADWIGSLGDPDLTVSCTEASISYHPDLNPQTLQECRDALRMRSSGQDGPPPYARCQVQL